MKGKYFLTLLDMDKRELMDVLDLSVKIKKIKYSKEFIKESSFLLSEYIRKSKWEFRGESKKKEAEAIPDSVKFLSGTIGLFYRLRLSSTWLLTSNGIGTALEKNILDRRVVVL